ncbi:hypothetical protein DITRI_Ditri16bG0019400 [Diplodiscus trichospermus]
MELRGQGKEMGMPSSFSYNHQLNRDSQRRDQTVHASDTRILNPNPPQTLDHQPEFDSQHQIQKLRRDLDHDPDPGSAPLATTGATVTARANRSSLRSPQHQPPTSEPSPVAGPASALIRYRECLKNHAASTGGHVLDGCGEFMPSGEEGTPEAMKCAACECHRNFHRKEVNGESQYVPSCYCSYNPNENNTRRDTVRRPPHQLHPQQPTPLRQQRLSLGGQSSHQQSSKKRFRTKFSQEQKDQMMEFAGKLGWRIQKQDEQEMQQFCAQVGVQRQVFKVWMHNNKQAMKKKQM